MDFKRPYHRRNPKLRTSTIEKIERLERKIDGLIAADYALYDAGLTHSGRGVAKGIDRRTREYKARKAAGALEAAGPPPGWVAPPGHVYDSDARALPKWADKPAGEPFRLPWKLLDGQRFFNPAHWSVVETGAAEIKVTRLGAVEKITDVENYTVALSVEDNDGKRIDPPATASVECSDPAPLPTDYQTAHAVAGDALRAQVAALANDPAVIRAVGGLVLDAEPE